MTLHLCEECETRFAPSRRDQFLCGSACKSRRHRRRRAEALAREVEVATRLLQAMSARAGLLPDD